MSSRKTLLSSSKTSSSERKILDPFIIIDNYKFTAIRYILLDVRYQIVVNIKSETLLNGAEEIFGFINLIVNQEFGEYVLENLSIEVCKDKLIKSLNNLITHFIINKCQKISNK